MSIKITDNTIEVQEGLASAIKRGLEAIGATAEGYAKDKAREQNVVDTGLLRNSITWALSGEAPNVNSYTDDTGEQMQTYTGTAPNDKDMAVYIGSNLSYFKYNELGTRKMPPRPMLRPAATFPTRGSFFYVQIGVSGNFLKIPPHSYRTPPQRVNISVASNRNAKLSLSAKRLHFAPQNHKTRQQR